MNPSRHGPSTDAPRPPAPGCRRGPRAGPGDAGRGLRLGPGYSILIALSECPVRPVPCGHAGMYGRHRPWWPRPGSPAGVGASHAPAATMLRRPVDLRRYRRMLSERQPTDRTTPHDPRRRVKYVRRLDQVQQLSPEQRDRLGPVEARYVFRANDYYLGLIDWDDPESSWRSSKPCARFRTFGSSGSVPRCRRSIRIAYSTTPTCRQRSVRTRPPSSGST